MTTLLWFAVFAITQVLACTPAVNQTKRCDDGNNIDGDGCSRTCQVEIGWKCPPSEIVGDCECYCINRNSAGELLNPPCLCDWKQTGTGAPLPQMSDFERVGFAFELADRNKMMQGFRFVRSGCKVDKTWEQRDTSSGPCPTGNGDDWEENEGLTLQVAANRKVSGKTDYDPAKAVYVQWVGAPIRQVTALERLAFECPPGHVPTSIYFEKAGCNAFSNFSTYAWATKIDLERRPGCMANSQNYNDGLTFVAECRPDSTLARGMWQWIDAGLRSPIVYPSDLADLGGLCPDGEVMTGAYFNAAGCGENLKWNQQLVGRDITPKCVQGQTNPDGTVSRNGLNLRLKCTKYGAREHFECGIKASRAEKPCDAQATCVETKDNNSTVIATRCVCNEGYEGTGRQGDCFPINHCTAETDECAPSPGGICTYTTPGKFTCACRQGYTGDGKTCVQTRTINDSPIVFPNFKAQCTFGGKPGSTVSGGFTLTTQRNSVGDPVGTRFEAELAGSGLSQVTTYDIYEFSVDTGPYLDSCWDAGRQFKRPNPGLTLKNGLLRANMVFYDASLYIMTDQAANNIIGRSIVLKDRTQDVVECCTIHLVGNSAATPADPQWLDTPSAATCLETATGRQLSFTQLTPQIGTPRDLEDNYGGGSIGSRVRVNHETPVVKTTFAAATDTVNWRDNAGNVPRIESCSGLRLLGGTADLGTGRWIQYNIPSIRVFRSATVKFTYHALGSWENEFARVEVRTGGRTPRTFSIWERTILSTGDCTSTRNRFPQEITFHLDHPQKDGVSIRFSSGLDGRGGVGGESFALSRFELVLEPTVLSTSVRDRPFSGASDLNSWTQIRANGQRFFPPVEACVVPGTDFDLLGGFMDIKDGDFLRYQKSGVAPFTRVQADFSFFFNKGWDGQTATLDLIRLNSAGVEVERVNVWRKTTTAAEIRASSINCGNQALKDLRVPVSAVGTISQLATTLRMEFKVGGKPLGTTASWAISSWSVRTLPTDQSEVFYQDRFRNYITSAGAAEDFKLIVNGRVTNIGAPPAKGTAAANGHPQWTYCQGSQSSRRFPFSFKVDDRSLRGYRGQDIRYSEARMRPFTRALITFDVFMLEIQPQTISVNVEGLGIVWKFSHGANQWWRARCTTNGRNSGVGQHVKDVAVYLKFPTPRTSLTVTWSTNAASTDPRTVSFALAAFKAELLPSDDQLRFIDENVHTDRFTYGIPRWGSGSQSFLDTPWLEQSERTFTNSGGVNPVREINKRCTVPEALRPAVGDAQNNVHTLLGYRLGQFQVLRYKNTTPRPYTKAIVSYYFWNLDSWNSVSVDPNHGERGYLRQRSQAPLQAAFPMRYLMSETYDKTEFFAPFCGNVPFTNLNFPDYVKFNANTMLETAATTNIDLFWGSTLNGDASNEAFAISRLRTILFPEVPGTFTIVRYTNQQFTTADGQRGQYTFDGTTRPPVISCAAVGTQALLGATDRLSGARTIRFDSGNLATRFISLRIHFRFFYLGDWNGERATLHLLGLSSAGAVLESRSIWRGDWRYWASNDIPHGNAGRLTTTMGRVCDQPGRSSSSVADWYQDVFVEGTFQAAQSRFRLEWATTLDNRALVESFAIGMINIVAVPVSTGALVETTQFKSTGNTLDGWIALDENVNGPPVIQACGNPPHFLVGGDEMGRRDKLQFTPFLNESSTPFRVAYAYFRYWYSPVWSAADKATLVVTRPGGQVVLTKEWEYPFYTREQPASNDFNCARPLPNLFKDYVVKIVFPSEVQTCTLTWGISGPSDTARFAISAFKLDRERRDPDWFITKSCGGAVFRPDDGNLIVNNGRTFGLGDLVTKHGPFRTKTFLDNSLVQYAPNSIIGNFVAFYDENTGSNGRLQGCCKIERVPNSPAAPKPNKPALQTAGCVWRNADSQGWVAFRAPSGVDNGAQVTVLAKFSNPTEAAGRHAWSINYNGFSLPQQAATSRCAPAMTGAIYGTGGSPRNHIGPTSAADSLGNPPFQGTAGSSRARIGDMSGIFGLLRGNTNRPISFNAGGILLSGPHSVVGRSVVIQSTTGVPIACCTIGMGLIGGSDTRLDYFDRLVNYTGPEPDDFPGFNDLEIPDPDTFLPPGVVQESQPASSFPFWNAARITALAVGVAAAALLAAALALGGGGAGAGGVTDPGDGYVAM